MYRTAGNGRSSHSLNVLQSLSTQQKKNTKREDECPDGVNLVWVGGTHPKTDLNYRREEGEIQQS
jgi:hypothetical protein